MFRGVIKFIDNTSHNCSHNHNEIYNQFASDYIVIVERGGNIQIIDNKRNEFEIEIDNIEQSHKDKDKDGNGNGNIVESMESLSLKKVQMNENEIENGIGDILSKEWIKKWNEKPAITVKLQSNKEEISAFSQKYEIFLLISCLDPIHASPLNSKASLLMEKNGSNVDSSVSVSVNADGIKATETVGMGMGAGIEKNEKESNLKGKSLGPNVLVHNHGCFLEGFIKDRIIKLIGEFYEERVGEYERKLNPSIIPSPSNFASIFGMGSNESGGGREGKDNEGRRNQNLIFWHMKSIHHYRIGVMEEKRGNLVAAMKSYHNAHQNIIDNYKDKVELPMEKEKELENKDENDKKNWENENDKNDEMMTLLKVSDYLTWNICRVMIKGRGEIEKAERYLLDHLIFYYNPRRIKNDIKWKRRSEMLKGFGDLLRENLERKRGSSFYYLQSILCNSDFDSKGNCNDFRGNDGNERNDEGSDLKKRDLLEEAYQLIDKSSWLGLQIERKRILRNIDNNSLKNNLKRKYLSKGVHDQRLIVLLEMERGLIE